MKQHTFFLIIIFLVFGISNINAKGTDSNITIHLIKEFAIDANASIYDMQYSLNKKSIFLVYGNNEIKVLNINSGKLFDVIRSDEYSGEHNEDGIYSIAFSPDEKRIISGTKETISIWDSTTYKLLKRFSISEISKNNIEISPQKAEIEYLPISSIMSLQYSPDGKMIMAFAANTIRIWDAKTTEVIKVFVGKNFKYADAGYSKYSPSGKEIAIQLNNESFNVGIYDSKNYKLKYKIGNPQNSMSHIEFSPDNKNIAVSYNNDSIKIFDIATGKLLHVLGGSIKTNIHIESMAYSPDGKILLSQTRANDIVKIWNTQTGKFLCSFKTGAYTPIKFISDRNFITVSDNKIKIWKIESREIKK